ncbi:thioredoxin [Sulfidibacter corallicola]|uniref:Thioredoxin n=1 Tax=Sulfidibacter corallicola TaxID=2818388 RepID=A0A8A4TGN5_SULCO|nr:thioredoxin [Sulfidibacter corallicola]QTD47951.1 thioredoxin [Sulfidibacter corallicola]
MSNLTAVTAGSFDAEVVNSDTLTLVDFWASWCGPCRMLAPTLERVQEERGDLVKIVKVNIEENPDVATRFKVTNIPLMLLFKDGQVVDQLLGNQPKAKIDKMIESHA